MKRSPTWRSILPGNEAAILGIRVFKGDRWIDCVRPATIFDVEVREPSTSPRLDAADRALAWRSDDKLERGIEEGKAEDADDSRVITRHDRHPG